MSPLLTLAIALSVVGQAGKPEDGDAAARLAIMKESLSIPTLTAADDPKLVYRLKADPVLRFNNSVGAVSDGAVFVWVDADDRPVVAVQVYKTTKGKWEHAFSSLSTTPLHLGGIWEPARAGVLFKPIPGAPKPADTAEQRLRQMRALAKDFGATMDLDFKTTHSLRMLSTPLVRYGKAGSGVLEGALYAFALTTDPEVYLLIEARTGKDGPEWQYAFAPEASAPIQCSLKGTPVWDFSADSRIFDPREPYFVHPFAADPR